MAIKIVSYLGLLLCLSGEFTHCSSTKGKLNVGLNYFATLLRKPLKYGHLSMYVNAIYGAKTMFYIHTFWKYSGFKVHYKRWSLLKKKDFASCPSDCAEKLHNVDTIIVII